MEKVLKKKVNKEDFYLTYLKTLNGHLSLTNRELQILVELCKLKANDTKLDSNARRLIRTKLNITPYNLNNIIKILKTKRILLLQDKEYTINPSLYVTNTDSEYSIKFKIEIIHE